MRKKSIQIYEVLLPIRDLTIKQKIIISQILYTIYRNKSSMNDIDITNDLKVKLSKFLRYKKYTIENALNKAVDLKIIGTVDEVNYYIYSSKYKVDNKSKYISIPFDIFLNGDLTETEKLILSYCNRFVNKYKSCKISNDFISKELYMPKITVEQSIIKLKRLGFINTTFSMKGCVTKNRQIYIDPDNLHELYIKHVERIEAERIEKIKRAEEIKTEVVENVENVENVEEINTDLVENVEAVKNIEKIETVKSVENLNLNIFELNDLSDILVDVKISKERAQELYFKKKKEFELIKQIYNNSLENE